MCPHRWSPRYWTRKAEVGDPSYRMRLTSCSRNSVSTWSRPQRSSSSLAFERVFQLHPLRPRQIIAGQPLSHLPGFVGLPHDWSFSRQHVDSRIGRPPSGSSPWRHWVCQTALREHLNFVRAFRRDVSWQSLTVYILGDHHHRVSYLASDAPHAQARARPPCPVYPREERTGHWRPSSPGQSCPLRAPPLTQTYFTNPADHLLHKAVHRSTAQHGIPGMHYHRLLTTSLM